MRRFEQQQRLTRRPAPADARQSLVALTPLGFEVFAPLQQQSRDDAASLLASLLAGQQRELVDAMQTVQRLLQPAAKSAVTRGATPTIAVVTRRAPQPGDMGWANVSFDKTSGVMNVRLGYTNGRPSSAVFSRELDAELARMQQFLGAGSCVVA